MERFEIRLSEETLSGIDTWRKAQLDLPSRSEAARRLLELAIGNSSRQGYFIMKFQMLSFYINTEGKAISNATAFAWSRDIFPIFEREEWAKPFEMHFSITKTMLQELQSFIYKSYRNGKPASFYQLEDLFAKKSANKWERHDLINSCRYFFLQGQVFPEDVWKELLRDSDYPVEAGLICEEIDESDIYV